MFKKKYLFFIFFNIFLLYGTFVFHKSDFFDNIRKEHYRLERIEFNKEDGHYIENRKDKIEPKLEEIQPADGKVENGSNLKKKRHKRNARYHFGFLLFQFISILTAVGIKFGKRVNFEENRRKDIEAAYIKSKHDLLRYQLQPHFFFNTLNSIHYLIDVSKEKAQETLIDLSQLMRYVLNVTEKELVEFEGELEFTKNYCELMRLRTADNLDFKLHIERGTSGQKIAPLLIIVLIENAFKHGLSGRETDFIHVHLLEKENVIDIIVQNSKYSDNAVKNGDVSIGLENLKSRLDLVYPDRYELKINETLTSYETILKLKS